MQESIVVCDHLEIDSKSLSKVNGKRVDLGHFYLTKSFQIFKFLLYLREI